MKKVDSSVLAMDCHAVQAPLAMTGWEWLTKEAALRLLCHADKSARNDRNNAEILNTPQAEAKLDSSKSSSDSKILDEKCGLQGKSQGSYLSVNDCRDFSPLAHLSSKAESPQVDSSYQRCVGKGSSVGFVWACKDFRVECILLNSSCKRAIDSSTFGVSSLIVKPICSLPKIAKTTLTRVKVPAPETKPTKIHKVVIKTPLKKLGNYNTKEKLCLKR